MRQILTRKVCSAVASFGILLALLSANQLFAQFSAPPTSATKKQLTKPRGALPPHPSCPEANVKEYSCPDQKPGKGSTAKLDTLRCELKTIEPPHKYEVKIDCDCKNENAIKPDVSCSQILPGVNGEESGCNYNFDSKPYNFTRYEYNSHAECQTDLTNNREKFTIPVERGLNLNLLCERACTEQSGPKPANNSTKVKCCTTTANATNQTVSPMP